MFERKELEKLTEEELIKYIINYTGYNEIFYHVDNLLENLHTQKSTNSLNSPKIT